MGRALEGPVPVVVMGLGFIGQEIARVAHASPELKLIGAVDPSPLLVGRKVGELIGVPSIAFKVSGTLEEALARQRAVVLLHATGSRLPQVMEQLMAAIRAGLSVVSTCEELSFPYLKYPDLAEQLERAAKRAGVSVLGGRRPGLRRGEAGRRHPRRRCPIAARSAAAQDRRRPVRGRVHAAGGK